MEAGAEMDNVAMEIYGYNALATAIVRKDILSISYLVETGVNINPLSAKSSAHTLLRLAAIQNDTTVVQHLLQLKADANDSDPLSSAIQTGNLEMARMLIEACMSDRSSDYGVVALQQAVVSCRLDMVNLLLQAGINVNALACSEFQRQRTISPYLMPHSLPSDFRGHPTTALEIAVLLPDLSMVRILLRFGANPNIVMQQSFMTPLVAAVYQKHVQLIRMLIEGGATVNNPGYGTFGRSALQAAAQEGGLDVVKVLLEAGADVNFPPSENSGVTALQAAAIGGFLDVACLLLTHEANVNAEPAKINGRSALEGAAEHGKIDMVKLLISSGALITGPGHEQYKRAVGFAEQHGHFAISRILRSST